MERAKGVKDHWEEIRESIEVMRDARLAALYREARDASDGKPLAENSELLTMMRIWSWKERRRVTLLWGITALVNRECAARWETEMKGGRQK